MATSAVTDSVDSEAEATLAELRNTTQRSDQEVVHVSCSRCFPTLVGLTL